MKTKEEIQSGQKVWYWSVTYECYKSDTVEQYCRATKMWWLENAEDWFLAKELYHTKEECAYANFPRT